jgi:hypothetical protein
LALEVKWSFLGIANHTDEVIETGSHVQPLSGEDLEVCFCQVSILTNLRFGRKKLTDNNIFTIKATSACFASPYGMVESGRYWQQKKTKQKKKTKKQYFY